MLASSASVFSQTSPSVFGERINAFSPTALDGLALWADASDQNSLLASDGSVIEDGEAVALWSDKSGSSTATGLLLNGVSGNYATSTRVIPTGSWRVEAKLALADYTPAGTQAIINVFNSAGFSQRSWSFALNTSSRLQMNLSSDGSSGTDQVVTSSVAVSATDFSILYVAADVDLVAGTLDFETSTDGVNWSALGVQQSFTPLTLFDPPISLAVGAVNVGTAANLTGIVYYARVYQTGTLVRNFDPSGAAKLASSFVAPTTGETWTINSTGATGARISGARDRYQGTVANRPLYSVSERSVTTDSSNDYMKGLAFSQGQPITIYAAMQQVTWTSGDYLFDGNTNDTLALIQTTSTPQLNISAGSSVAANTGLAVATKGVVSAIYNGANSSLRINRGTATTGNAGAGTANGLTIGSKADGSAAGNGKYYEILVYSGAHDTATRDRITQYLGRKWGIAV